MEQLASNDSDYTSIRELLSQCGLNPTEQTIILQLLENRRSGAGAIARKTGIKRPTVYSALSNLETQGLVTKQRFRGTVLFSPVSPRTIPIVLKNRAREKFKKIEGASKQLELQLPLLSREVQHSHAGYEISVQDSIDAVYALLENAITSGDYRGVFNPQLAFAGKGKALIERFLERDAIECRSIQEIVVAGPMADWYRGAIKNPRHEVKVIEGNVEKPMDCILLHNASVVIDYAHPTAKGIVIRHEGYQSFMSTYFDTLWAALPESAPTVKIELAVQ